MDERKILIVEDEKKIADTLKLGLTEIGFYAEIAADGDGGINSFMSGPFDLVILDVNLPGINGYEVCKAIRRHNTNVPIVMLTAMSRLNSKIEGYDAGADDYIVKPFEFRELVLKIKVLLKRAAIPQLPRKNILKAADLELNLETKEVTREGQIISLTAKEFQLLEYLLRNKNRVVSRTDIAVNVWDIDFETNTNLIDVYISYIRNKIDKNFDQKLIQTLKGMGYVLKENNR